MDAVTDRREIEGGEGIEEAGREASQAAVAEAHVVLLIAERVGIESEFLGVRPPPRRKMPAL